MTDILIRKVQVRLGTVAMMNRYPHHKRQIARCALRDVKGTLFMEDTGKALSTEGEQE